MHTNDIQSGKWINDYAKAMYQLFEGQVIEGFQPVDFFSFFPLWFDLWVEKIDEALERAKVLGWPRERLYEIMPVPSNLRAHLQKIIPTLDRIANKDQARRVIEFIVSALAHKTLMDPFGKESTIIHNPDQLDELLRTALWKISNTGIAKELGRLLTAAGSLTHGLYNDVGTDYGWEAYGPYPLPTANSMMLIRHFTDLKPRELWSERTEISEIPSQEILLYEVYSDIKCTIKTVGCHTIFDGSPVEHLASFAIRVDGRWVVDIEEIRLLRQRLALEAQAHYQYIRDLSEEQLRSKVVEQECFQWAALFRFVGMDWRPTLAMLERAQLPMLQDRYPKGRFMTFEEYCRYMGVNELKKMYGLQSAIRNQQSAIGIDYTVIASEAKQSTNRHHGSDQDPSDSCQGTSERPQARMTMTGNDNRPWLDEFLDAFALAVSNSDAAGWMPFDYHRFYPYVSDLILDRWIEVVQRLRERTTNVWDIAKTIGGPLTMRFEFIFLNLFHLQSAGRRNDARAWKAIEFLNTVIQAASVHDPYGFTSAYAHSESAVAAIQSGTSWNIATEQSRKEITRLLSAATHMVWALYGDYCYMNWYEIFGSYPLPGNRQLLIRAFTNFNPKEIWPSFAKASEGKLLVSSLMLYQIFKDTDIHLDQWSHTLATTPIGERLEQWALQIGGEWITDLSRIRTVREQLERAAAKQHRQFSSLGEEEMKVKVLDLQGYGLKNLFALAGMDWRPNSEMLERVRGKPFLPDVYPKFASTEHARGWWRTFADPRTEECFPKEFTTAFAQSQRSIKNVNTLLHSRAINRVV